MRGGEYLHTIIRTINNLISVLRTFNLQFTLAEGTKPTAVG